MAKMPLHGTSTLLLVWCVLGLAVRVEERTAILADGTDFVAEEAAMPAWPVQSEGDESHHRTVGVRFFRPRQGHGICGLKLIDVIVDVDGFWRAGGPGSGEELFLSLYVDGRLVGTRVLGDELAEPANEHLVESPRVHLLWVGPALERPNFERPAGLDVLLRQQSESSTFGSGSTGAWSGKTWSHGVRVKLVAERAVCMEHRYEALQLFGFGGGWIPGWNITGISTLQNATIVYPQSNTVHALSSRSRLLYEFQAPAGDEGCALVLWVNRMPAWYYIQPPSDQAQRLENMQILLFPDHVSEPGWSELCLTLHREGHLTQRMQGSLDDRNFFYQRLGQSCAMAFYDEAAKLAKVGDIVRSDSSQCGLARPLACQAGSKGQQCSGRGECHPMGWCECGGSRFGERCEHDLMSATTIMLDPAGVQGPRPEHCNRTAAGAGRTKPRVWQRFCRSGR